MNTCRHSSGHHRLPLSTSGSPAQLSATRRKLQRHGRICRTQKFRRLTRGASPIFRPDAPSLHRRDGERRLSHLRTIAGQQRKTKRVQYAKSWQCETGTSAGELRAEPRAMRLVNHPFRLDSQRLLSYLTSMRVLTLAVTPAISTTFLEHDLFLYRLSRRRKPQLRLCPGETLHRERSGLTTTCGCLFGFVYKRKPTHLERFIREESSQRAPPFFCGWWEYKLD